MATIRKGNAVIVTRHVERPRRIVTNHHHHHHHHHHHYVHHNIKREVNHYGHGANPKRFINRRADLLQHSQRLRQSARLPVLTPLLSMPSSSNKHKSPQTKAVNTRRKPKDSVAPSCFGNCKLMLPNIFKLLSFQTKKASSKKKTSNKIKAVLKSLEGQKRRGFLAKLSLTSTKHR